MSETLVDELEKLPFDLLFRTLIHGIDEDSRLGTLLTSRCYTTLSRSLLLQIANIPFTNQLAILFCSWSALDDLNVKALVKIPRSLKSQHTLTARPATALLVDNTYIIQCATPPLVSALRGQYTGQLLHHLIEWLHSHPGKPSKLEIWVMVIRFTMTHKRI